MPLREEPGIALDSKRRVRFEPRRNDRFLNTHNRAAFLAWRANVDFKPVLRFLNCSLGWSTMPMAPSQPSVRAKS